ncbi:MAG: hypothetical protein H0V70_30155 [Ktedonobacteraceae bacterium]|nr:hypothetical protein [Ktedonobacteraceae bacterium]
MAKQQTDEPVTLEEQIATLREKIKQKKKYLEDEPRTIQMSHIGWFKLRRVAKKRRIPISALLEMISDEQGKVYLDADDLQSVETEAQEILERRKVPLQDLEEQLAALEQQLAQAE